jgi:hypothetical protein
VGIERRSTDIGLVADVLDRDRLLALFQDQGGQGVLQHAPGSDNAAVYRVFCQLHHHSRSDRTDRALTDISRDLFVDKIPDSVSVIIQHVRR